jgi:ADP-ribose pyrophosphatase YjhB (NUDIX family)
MAWIEDVYGQVILVRQTRGKKWTLPGGKVRPKEGLKAALRRELREETGLQISRAEPVDLFDRPKKGTIAVLFRVLIRKNGVRPRARGDVDQIALRRDLPKSATPSARYFFKRADRSFEPMFLFSE